MCIRNCPEIGESWNLAPRQILISMKIQLSNAIVKIVIENASVATGGANRILIVGGEHTIPHLVIYDAAGEHPN